MISNWKRSFDLLLQSEGGYADHPSDPGGRTNLGVTQVAWESYVGRSSNEKEMRALTREMVEPLYKRKYWDACRCDELPTGIDYLIFDFAVNAGVGRSVKTLQQSLGVIVDGAIGTITLRVANTENPIEIINKFSSAKEVFYRSLPTFAVFGGGWLNRVDRVKNEAILISADKG